MCRRFLAALGMTLFLVINSSAFAKNDYQASINHVINQLDPKVNMGMVVIDLSTGETLYQRNPNQAFIPASNMKLFSNAAALIALGPDYRFLSKLTTDASILDHGVLNGSLYLHLSGDPSLTQENINTMLMELPKWGIQHIQGNIIVVSNNSIVNPYPPGRLATDARYSYGAPITPLVINDNQLTVTVNPDYKAGNPALVEIADPNINLIINNQVKTVKSGSKCGIDLALDNENMLTVRGCIQVGQWAMQQRLPIRNPLRFVHDLVRQQLKHLGIKLDGEVSLGNSPLNSLLLASHTSKPIAQLMADTLKPSDNVYADSLYLHTAAKLNGASLNWQASEPVVKKFLQEQTGINLNSALLVDGSGLSRQDLVTAQQTVELLRFLYDRFPLAYEYIAALPIAGHDGTLQKRFRKPSQQGLLRAKTGTMTGIISLSGFLYTANAHTLAFAIYINRKHGVNPRVSGRTMIDRICDFLLKQKPTGYQAAAAANPYPRLAYQQQPTHNELQHKHYARWRQIEFAVKRAIQGKAVTVIYRGDHIILQDKEKDVNRVWSVLQTLRRQYQFSVALQGKKAPTNGDISPHLLWIKMSKISLNRSRTWTLSDIG